MPRYFIDTDDGDIASHDDTGYLLAHANAARELAMEAFPDMAREEDTGWRRTHVRGAGPRRERRTIYEATLTLKG